MEKPKLATGLMKLLPADSDITLNLYQITQPFRSDLYHTRFMEPKSMKVPE